MSIYTYNHYLRNEALRLYKKKSFDQSSKYFERYLYHNPNDSTMWISYSQMMKKPFRSENKILRVQRGYITNTTKNYVSRKSIIRSRKILYRGIQINDCNHNKAKIMLSLGLLEIQHGNQKYGIALIEKSVYLSRILLPVLKWQFIKQIIKNILHQSDLLNARHCCKLLIV